jgi:hypothetical protein
MVSQSWLILLVVAILATTSAIPTSTEQPKVPADVEPMLNAIIEDPKPILTEEVTDDIGLKRDPKIPMSQDPR